MTFSSYKKDVYFHLKSLLRKTPVIHLVGPHYFLRSADAANRGAVKAYSTPRRSR